MDQFSIQDKIKIEAEIEEDFVAALAGIKSLPTGSRFGVYVAYIYYKRLFDKIKSTPATEILSERIRVSNPEKVKLLVTSYVRHAFKLI
jgi:phytoene/squalene synthetase